MSARFWAPTRPGTSPDPVVLAMCEPGDLTAALLAAHRAGAAAAEQAASMPLLDEATFAGHLAAARGSFVPPVHTAISKKLDFNYSALLLRDVLDDAEAGTMMVFKSARAAGVPASLAAQRAGMVYGVPPVMLAGYVAKARDAKTPPALLVELADDVLMRAVGAIAEQESQEVAKADVAVATRPRVWDESQVRRDAEGKFAREGRIATENRARSLSIIQRMRASLGLDNVPGALAPKPKAKKLKAVRRPKDKPAAATSAPVSAKVTVSQAATTQTKAQVAQAKARTEAIQAATKPFQAKTELLATDSIVGTATAPELPIHAPTTTTTLPGTTSLTFHLTGLDAALVASAGQGKGIGIGALLKGGHSPSTDAVEAWDTLTSVATRTTNFGKETEHVHVDMVSVAVLKAKEAQGEDAEFNMLSDLVNEKIGNDPGSRFTTELEHAGVYPVWQMYGSDPGDDETAQVAFVYWGRDPKGGRGTPKVVEYVIDNQDTVVTDHTLTDSGTLTDFTLDTEQYYALDRKPGSTQENDYRMDEFFDPASKTIVQRYYLVPRPRGDVGKADVLVRPRTGWDETQVRRDDHGRFATVDQARSVATRAAMRASLIPADVPHKTKSVRRVKRSSEQKAATTATTAVITRAAQARSANAQARSTLTFARTAKTDSQLVNQVQSKMDTLYDQEIETVPDTYWGVLSETMDYLVIPTDIDDFMDTNQLAWHADGRYGVDEPEYHPVPALSQFDLAHLTPTSGGAHVLDLIAANVDADLQWSEANLRAGYDLDEWADLDIDSIVPEELGELSMTNDKQTFANELDAIFRDHPNLGRVELFEHPENPDGVVVAGAPHLKTNDQVLLSMDPDLDWNKPLAAVYLGSTTARSLGYQDGDKLHTLSRVIDSPSAKRQGVLYNPTVHAYRLVPRPGA